MGTKESEEQAELVRPDGTPEKSVRPFVKHRSLNGQKRAARHRSGVPLQATVPDFVYHEADAEAAGRLPEWSYAHCNLHSRYSVVSHVKATEGLFWSSG